MRLFVLYMNYWHRRLLHQHPPTSAQPTVLNVSPVHFDILLDLQVLQRNRIVRPAHSPT